MARRLEIELTSARPDGTWTWRAAGALNPRGSLESSLLYNGAKVGDVVRAEAEFGIDGITVVAIEPPRSPEAEDPNRIQLLDRPTAGGVTTQLLGRARTGSGRGDERRRGDGAGAREREPLRGARRPGFGEEAGSQAEGQGERNGGPASDRGRRPRAGRPAGRPAATHSDPEQTLDLQATEASAPADGAGAGRGPARTRTDRPRPDRARPDRPRREGGAPDLGPERRASGTPVARRGRGPGDRPARDAASVDGRHEGASQRQRRLYPGNAHRNAMLDSLPPEQRAIAQQVLRGGIPAVRTALHFEREKAREEGRPEPSTEGVLAIAESLVGKVKAAEWRDRAEAALKAGDDLTMRDLRSLVSGSDVARDEASRELVVSLREMLEQRVEAHRGAWANEVARHLDDGQVLRALRLSAHPPDPGARFSAELAVRLRDAAGEALSPAQPADRWLAVLQAASESPVRRTVKPTGLPASPSSELLEAARQQCGRIPGLAPLLGITVPPPPGPVRHPVSHPVSARSGTASFGAGRRTAPRAAPGRSGARRAAPAAGGPAPAVDEHTQPAAGPAPAVDEHTRPAGGPAIATYEPTLAVDETTPGPNREAQAPATDEPRLAVDEPTPGRSGSQPTMLVEGPAPALDEPALDEPAPDEPALAPDGAAPGDASVQESEPVGPAG